MKGSAIRRIAFEFVLIFLGIGIITAAAQKPSTSPPPAKTAKTPPASAKTAKTAPDPAKASAGETSDPVVLKVGNQKISKGDFDFMLSTLDQNGQQMLATQGRKPFADNYVNILLLYQQAVNDHVDASPDVTRELAMGRLRTIAQAEYQHLAEQTSVTPEEVDTFYKSHVQDMPEERDIREVAVIRKPAGAPANAQGLDDATARERAETIRKSLASGTDPEKLIKDFAVPNIVLIDAKPNPIRQGQLIASLDKPAFELKDGETSDVIETPQAFVFIQALGRHKPELKEVTPEIENAIRQQKLNTHMQQLKEGSTIWMDEQYFKPPQAAAPPAPAVAPPAPTTTPASPTKP